ncbi:unnamed protein product [Linum tenue]|uniref:Uncharacterized protein n=1 Tax=Linum tenue TaxID=586396 RepID=A0AAV0RSY9_9ROSI|nr:unnamed protein product [Linum tenue]
MILALVPSAQELPTASLSARTCLAGLSSGAERRSKTGASLSWPSSKTTRAMSTSSTSRYPTMESIG